MLVLNTWGSDTIPMIIDFDGKIILSDILPNFIKAMSAMTLTLNLAPMQTLFMDVASHS